MERNHAQNDNKELCCDNAFSFLALSWSTTTRTLFGITWGTASSWEETPSQAGGYNEVTKSKAGSMGSQHPSPNVKTFCNFERQIWLEIITSRDAESACFKGSRTSCREIFFSIFGANFGQKRSHHMMDVSCWVKSRDNSACSTCDADIFLLSERRSTHPIVAWRLLESYDVFWCFGGVARGDLLCTGMS